MTELSLAAVAEATLCPECGAPAITDAYTGEVMCPGCGLVIYTHSLSQEAEWGINEPTDYYTRPRTAAPRFSALPELDTTAISWPWSHTDPETRAAVRRISKMQRRLVESRRRNFSEATNFLLLLADQIDMPWNLRHQAAAIYRKAYNLGIVKGRTIRSIVAGCIYATYRINNIPRTRTELAKPMDIHPVELSRMYRLLCTSLDLRPQRQRAEDHVAKLADALHLTPEETRATLGVLHEARRRRITAGQHPQGLAAAAVYLTTINTRHNQRSQRITQKDIAEAVGVTEGTVRNHCKKLEKTLPSFTGFTRNQFSEE